MSKGIFRPIGLAAIGVLLASIGLTSLSDDPMEEIPSADFTERKLDGPTPTAPPDTVIHTPNGIFKPKMETVGTLPGPEPEPQELKNLNDQIKSAPNNEIKPLLSKGLRVAINFPNGEFVPPAGQRIQPELRQAAAANPYVYAIALLDRRLDDVRADFARLGVEPIHFYPYTAYTVRIPSQSLDAMASVPGVVWVGMQNLHQKLDVHLGPYMDSGSKQEISLYICLFDNDQGAERTYMESIGVRVGKYYPTLKTYYAVGNSEQILKIAQRMNVVYIERLMQQHVLHGESQTQINSDRMWGVHDGRPETGRPQVLVGVMDTGFRISHDDFTNIFGGTIGINYTGETTVYTDGHGHGTHVMGTFIGEGNANLRYRGAASGVQDTGYAGYDLALAKVFNSAGNSVGSSVYDGFNYLHVTRPREVLNYSGGGYSGTPLVGTDTNSRKVDEMFEDNILCVIAAGNDGSGAQTINQPGVAKGAFTVGNIYDNDENGQIRDTMRASSSRGPTGDGRAKPDVVAGGAYIDSTGPASDTAYLLGWTGTSMASPHVAGSAASLLQHYGWPVRAIKTIMMASSIDLGLGLQNQGSGRIDRYSMHYFTDGTWNTWYSSIGATGNLSYVDFDVPAGTARLRIVMLYADPPAAAGAGSALVNDLDLYIQNGALTTTATGNWSSLSSSDNVERITINSPAAGTYRLKVYAFNNSGARPWAATVKFWNNTAASLSTSFTGPVAVKPSAAFSLTGTVTNAEYVAPSVHGDIDVLSGAFVINGTTVRRRSPTGSTETFFLDLDDGTNQGDIAPGLSRTLVFSLNAPATEGTYNLRYDADPSLGTTSSTTKSVIVDGTPPVDWGSLLPSGWTTDQTPDCSLLVRDVLSGISASDLYYWYYLNGSQFGPFAATWSGADGATSLNRINALAVPFNQNSNNTGSNTQVYFRAYDRAGNYSDSGWQPILIDNAVPTGWTNQLPTDYVYTNTPNCTIQVQDLNSGLNVSTAEYRYSINNGVTYSAWTPATCTGSNGTNALQTITASNVPFNQASGSLNRIQFRIRDMANNLGTSSTYVIKIGAIVEATAFTLGPGATTSGSIASIYASDDVRWNLRPTAVAIATQDNVSLILTGTAPAASPVQIRMVVESSASVGGIRQTVDAFNFSGSTYTNLEVFTPLPTSPDRNITLNIPNPALHKSGGNILQARLRYKNTSPVAVFPWNARIDRFYWMYDPS